MLYRPTLTLLLAGLTIAPLSAAATVTGICPDGSVFIIPDHHEPPCKQAKEVEPSEVPPLKPDYLPSPYTWQVYNEAQDPHNPYNLIDSVRDIRALREHGPGVEDAAEARGGGDPATLAAHAPVGPLDLGLSDDEMRDLYQIVDYSQDVAPAAFERSTAGGKGVFRLALARSSAFEDRLARAWQSRGGIGASEVLLFTAVSMEPEPFYANLTFVQDHLTFQPDPENARQIGILQGRLGDLSADEVVLGYVILPEQISLADPMEIYWNDRRISVSF